MGCTITFLLPGPSKGPTGGVKVAIEYANRFAEAGYSTNIVYPISMFFKGNSLKNKLRYLAFYLYYGFNHRYSVRKWMNLHPLIKEYWAYSLNERHVPKSDVYVATAATTAIYLNSYKKNVRKIHLIQGHENWILDEKSLMEVYNFSMERISISNWLYNLLISKGISSNLIFNGFDFDYFKCTNSIENRDKYTISMMYHYLESKGFADGFKALEIVKEKYPQLKVLLFGAYKPPHNLPNWFVFNYKPNRIMHNNIYNSSSIYLGTSHAEGWGLTVGEAMICGNAVVCTNNQGYLEMAKDGINAIVVPVKASKQMADAIIRLIENDNMRCSLAYNAITMIKQFNWDTSFVKFKNLVEK